ncbi:MAG: HPr family phosphocarrier protein [Lachnospiraceae bacterium]
MVEKKVIVKNKSGLHARPATLLMQLCQKYESDITIFLGSKQINPKSIISILGGGIISGSEIVLRAEGMDEQEAVEAIVNLMDKLEE